MNSKRSKKIFLFSLFISFCSILFFLSLGRNVEFETQGLYSWVANLIGYGLLLFQFILHFPLLVLIDYLVRKKSSKSEENNTVLWIYLTIAFIINIIVILAATTESRDNLKNDSEWQSAEKYEWQEGISCPKNYPVIVLNGNFSINITHSGDPYYKIENKIYDLNWSIDEPTSVSEFDKKRVMPDSLHVLWYSIIEKTYYQLDTPLNKQKITTLFRNGFSSKNSSGIFDNTFDYIIAGLAPGGDVAVWTRSNWGHSAEVGFYKAQKMDSLKIPEFSRTECQEKLKRAISGNDLKWSKILNSKKDSIPYGIWRDKYRQKFNWKFQCNLESKLEDSDIKIKLFNGEEFILINDELSEKEISPKAVPSEIKLIHLYQKKTKRSWADLDENDVYKAFKTLSAENKNTPIIIECNLNNQGEIESVNAKNKSKTIQLKLIED